MFERIKRSDEASASSAQGKKSKKFKVVFVAVTFKNLKFKNVTAINRSISSPWSSIAYFDFLNFIMKLRWKE